MENNDPLKRIEEMVQDIHDRAGKYTQPVLRRYPLLFAFLITFSLASILYGFELWAGQIELFREHPLFLIALGAVALGLTGTLYKALQKID